MMESEHVGILSAKYCIQSSPLSLMFNFFILYILKHTSYYMHAVLLNIF